MFLFFICIRARALKLVTFPLKKSIGLLIGDAPHMLENWVMDLSHPYLSMYPYDLWWTVQSNGMM